MSFVESILLSFFQSGCFLFHFLAQLSWRNSSTMFNKRGERGHIFLLIDLRGNHLACVCMLKHLVVSDSLQPLDCSLPGSSVHGICQARILEWVAMPFSRESSSPGYWTQVSCIAGGFFTIWVYQSPLGAGFIVKTKHRPVSLFPLPVAVRWLVRTDFGTHIFWNQNP